MYLNTVMQGGVTPTVISSLERPWLTATAAVYVAMSPPDSRGRQSDGKRQWPYCTHNTIRRCSFATSLWVFEIVFMPCHVMSAHAFDTQTQWTESESPWTEKHSSLEELNSLLQSRLTALPTQGLACFFDFVGSLFFGHSSQKSVCTSSFANSRTHVFLNIGYLKSAISL